MSDSMEDSLLDDLYECECNVCKNIWWVPRIGGDLMASECLPRRCCFCEAEFGVYEHQEEDG